MSAFSLKPDLAELHRMAAGRSLRTSDRCLVELSTGGRPNG